MTDWPTYHVTYKNRQSTFKIDINLDPKIVAALDGVDGKARGNAKKLVCAHVRSMLKAYRRPAWRDSAVLWANLELEPAEIVSVA